MVHCFTNHHKQQRNALNTCFDSANKCYYSNRFTVHFARDTKWWFKHDTIANCGMIAGDMTVLPLEGPTELKTGYLLLSHLSFFAWVSWFGCLRLKIWNDWVNQVEDVDNGIYENELELVLVTMVNGVGGVRLLVAILFFFFLIQRKGWTILQRQMVRGGRENGKSEEREMIWFLKNLCIESTS